MLVESMVIGGVLGSHILGNLGLGIYNKKKLDERFEELDKKFVTKEEFTNTVNVINGKSDEILNILKAGMQQVQPAPAQSK